MTGFPGLPGRRGETIGSNIPGPLGDPGLPGLDGEEGSLTLYLAFYKTIDYIPLSHFPAPSSPPFYFSLSSPCPPSI